MVYNLAVTVLIVGTLIYLFKRDSKKFGGYPKVFGAWMWLNGMVAAYLAFTIDLVGGSISYPFAFISLVLPPYILWRIWRTHKERK
mgnify:CR=1 FL=1